jgi:hypothetical protein
VSIDVLQQVRSTVAQLGDQTAQAQADLASATEAVDAAIEEARRLAALGDDAGTTQTQANVEKLQADRRAVLDRLSSIDANVVQQLALLNDLDPCDAESDVPLALLPVRLETRYSPDGTMLRVRIYPDVIHADGLDRGVADAEKSAALAYWNALWAGTKRDVEAWNQLLQAVHPNRAAWVAKSLTPTNLAARPDPPAATPAPAFPTVQSRTHPAPVARALPDRFVVVADQGGRESTATGTPLAPQVVVGLASDGDPSSLVGPDGTPLGGDIAWMVDYDKAEAAGLAVTLPLAVPGGRVDTLLVFGVRSSLAPDAAAAELSQLLLAHRFDDGFVLVGQGTPTNNTETDRSAWVAHPAPIQPPTRANAGSADAGSNGAVLAQALGIDPTVVAGTDGSDAPEQPLAGATNTACWTVTWGTFLDRLLLAMPSGGPTDEQREALRDFFQDDVRGRGPLPALRLGAQPYGVLPVSSVDTRWVPTGADPIEQGLTALLHRVRAIWRASLTNVPALGSGDPIDDTLLEILGSAPQLLGLRVRSIASESACVVVPPLLGVDAVDTDLQRISDLLVWGSLGLPADTVGLTGTLSKTTLPLGLPLADDSDPAYIAALLADGPRSVASVLQALLELAYDAEQRAVTAASPKDNVEQLSTVALQGAGNLADTVGGLVHGTLAGDAKPEEQLALANTLGRQFGWTGPVTLALADPVAGVRGSLASLALQPQVPSQDVPALALQTIGAWLRTNARLTSFKTAIGVIAAATTNERRIALAETLDCSSHRLDAWTTALVSRRLRNLRSATPTGLMLGAYGFVEGIEPAESEQRDGGYILAPSISHAATAGVLRSAYLTHNRDGSGSGAFAVDLSSARVRVALKLVEGIRNGQPLGALLGYRLERLLHESTLGLDRFVLSLRALAPLVGDKLHRGPEAPPQQALEAISAQAVVDGVQLLALRAGGTDIRSWLSKPPANNPYLDPNRPWTGPDDSQWSAVNDALDDIASVYDACADLLLSDAVHQLVQGNSARASAALSALSGDALPSDPEVAHIPARGVPITHRVMLLVRDLATGSGGWATTTPRAAAEPRLAGWAETVLGPADRIVVQVGPHGARTTLDAAHLAAIDVVYDAAVPSILVQRLRRAIPGLLPAPLATHRDPAWPEGLRAIGEVIPYAAALQKLLAKAQPVLPSGFARPADHPARSVLPADLAELKTRLTTAANMLAGIAAQLANALEANPLQPGVVASAVGRLAAYGVAIPGAAPQDPVVARAALAEARRRVTAAGAKLAATSFSVQDAIDTAKALFGEAFWALPVVSAGGPDLYSSAFGRIAPGQAKIRRFLRDIASVRGPLAPYAGAMLLGDALGVQRNLFVAQLAPSGTPGADRWLGLPFDDTKPSPDVPVTDLVVEGPADMKGTDRVVGLVLDEWVEVVPQRIERPDGAGGTVREAVITAGIALNTATPAARAPQAILLGVSPDGARWTTNTIADLLRETLELAKLRAVTLERALWAGRVLPALYEQSWSLQGEKALDIRALANSIGKVDAMIPFVRETG